MDNSNDNLESNRNSPPGILIMSKIRGRNCCFNLYRYLVLIITFIAYTCHHASRKPSSIVKSVPYPEPALLFMKTDHTYGQLGRYFIKKDLGIVNNIGRFKYKGWEPFDGKDRTSKLGEIDLAFLASYAVGMYFAGSLADSTDLRRFLAFGMIGSGEILQQVYQEREAAMLAKKQRTYTLLEADDEDVDVKGISENVNESKAAPPRREDSHSKRFRKRTEAEEEEDDEVVRVVKERNVRMRNSEESDSLESEEERPRDQKKREELVQHLRERDATGTRKNEKNEGSEHQEREAAMLAKKQRTYTLLEADDEDVDVKGISENVNESNASPPRREDSHSKRFRKRAKAEKEEDDEVVRVDKERNVRMRNSEESDSSESEEGRLRDQKEREELVQHLRKRDAAGTRKDIDEVDSAGDIDEVDSAGDIDAEMGFAGRIRGLSSGTTLFAAKANRNVVLGADSRGVTQWYGRVADNKVKLFWVYKDVFIAGAGSGFHIERITDEMKSYAQKETIRVMNTFPMHLADLANTYANNTKCHFIVVGRLKINDNPCIYTVNTEDGPRVNDYTYHPKIPEKDMKIAVAGCGRPYVNRFITDAERRLEKIRADNDCEGLKNYVRDGIGRLEDGTTPRMETSTSWHCLEVMRLFTRPLYP